MSSLKTSAWHPVSYNQVRQLGLYPVDCLTWDDSNAPMCLLVFTSNTDCDGVCKESITAIPADDEHVSALEDSFAGLDTPICAKFITLAEAISLKAS